MFTAGHEYSESSAVRANRIFITKIILDTLSQNATIGIFLLAKIS